MSDIEQVATDLFEKYLKFKKLEGEVKELKEQILKYFEKVGLKKYTADDFILEEITRETYDTPTPKRLKQIMGDEFNLDLLTVKPEVRLQLPPEVAGELFKVKTVSSFIAVKSRKL